VWGVPQYFYGILEFYDPAEFFGSISGGILELTLEMPLANANLVDQVLYG
jgi:hypothetical protein